ncbi:MULTISPECIES: flagellar biosynthetic protein FliR [Polaromonas]|uniref:Flagellar biosynthetic protein FliR n=1 Tax=Polaromonas aquatica TaxID=332657 RepID=A0ABW1TYI6_9BURK
MPAVFSVSSEQLSIWLVAFLWPFVRILALISTSPVFGEKSVPRRAKVGLAALLAIAIAPTLGALPAVPLVSAGGIWILIQQVLIGVAMGFSMRLVFTIVQAAGEYTGLQMGLSFASFFDPTSGGNTMVVSRLLNVMAILIFLAVDGHLALITTLAESFHTLPIADTPLAASGWFLLVASANQIFVGGLMLALPLIATLLTLNLAMGILNRVSPQFSIFAVGFPITLLAGLAMLQMLMQYLAPFLATRFAENFGFIDQFLQGLRP